MKPYLDICEICRQPAPGPGQPGYEPRLDVLRAIYVSLEHLVLYAIDTINLIEALSFAEEAQDPAFYRTTIVKHFCIHLYDLNERLNTKILGKPFQDALRRIPSAFHNMESHEVPQRFNRLVADFNRRMDRNGDKAYVYEIRNNIAAHKSSDVDIYIEVNQRLNATRIGAIVHDTLRLLLDFLKALEPLKNEVLGIKTGGQNRGEGR